jgi:hypothetical protein
MVYTLETVLLLSAVRIDPHKIMLAFKSQSKINEEGRCDVGLLSSAKDTGRAGGK